jgi:peroxiredoxin
LASIGSTRLSLVAVILATVVGVIPLNPVVSLAVESSGLDNFHFFPEPPEANDLTMIAVNDQTLKLSQFKGKVVLLNFWRQNCQYCHKEKEYLREMVSALKTNDLTVLCVDFWDQPSWVQSYAKKNKGDLTFAFQPPGTDMVMENVSKGRILGYFILNQAKEAIYEIKGFPSTYVIDREGKVVAAHLGMAQWSDPAIMQWVASLVKPVTSAPFSPPDAYYELPSWMDRMLGDSTPGRGASRDDTVQTKPRTSPH